MNIYPHPFDTERRGETFFHHSVIISRQDKAYLYQHTLLLATSPWTLATHKQTPPPHSKLCFLLTNSQLTRQAHWHSHFVSFLKCCNSKAIFELNFAIPTDFKLIVVPFIWQNYNFTNLKSSWNLVNKLKNYIILYLSAIVIAHINLTTFCLPLFSFTILPRLFLPNWILTEPNHCNKSYLMNLFTVIPNVLSLISIIMTNSETFCTYFERFWKIL